MIQPAPPLQPAPADDPIAALPIPVQQVLCVVADYYHIPPAQIVGRRMHSYLAWPRHIVCYLLRERTRYSFDLIGQMLGGRNHSTVVCGVRRVRECTDLSLWRQLCEIEERLKGA